MGSHYAYNVDPYIHRIKQWLWPHGLQSRVYLRMPYGCYYTELKVT